MSDASYDRIGRALADLIATQLTPGARARTVVGVAGESGSGKSTTATALARAFAADGLPAEVLFQDDYFHRPPLTNHEHRVQDITSVGPQEVDLARIEADIAAFRTGRDGVVVPSVDYPANVFRTRIVNFGTARVLVVEGTYVLMLPTLDVRVFLEATYADTRARRVARARDVDSPFVEQVLAIEHAIIARQLAVADVIVDREFRVRRA